MGIRSAIGSRSGKFFFEEMGSPYLLINPEAMPENQKCYVILRKNDLFWDVVQCVSNPDALNALLTKL